MSALDDILRAIHVAQHVPADAERVVMIGMSARRSIEADFHSNGRIIAGWEDEFETVTGYPINAVNHFDGWAIQDVDKAGTWHDVEAAA